jgi:hypothetical protein
MSFKVEFIADSSGQWVGNSRHYPSRKVAEDAARGLFLRWTAVREWRVVEESPGALCCTCGATLALGSSLCPVCP